MTITNKNIAKEDKMIKERTQSDINNFNLSDLINPVIQSTKSTS